MKPIFSLLSWLFEMIGNFGLAIICLTLIVRGLMFPIAQKQFASMAKMRVVQPKMKAIQDRYKDDKPRLQQEMLKLYQEEKVNPVGGCLPILLQIPVFYALYKVLMLSVEMRHQPFVLWIKDLSAPDPLTPVNLFGFLPFTPPHFLALGVLPILLGITMWLQFRLNPAPMDPVQKQVFGIMPWVMMFVMAPFAAGLQLYWTVSNILTIAQQKWLYSRYPGLQTAPEAK
jgi:YidC/Oxa1 family membrane protein insertase